jgi:hypothetical protein
MEDLNGNTMCVPFVEPIFLLERQRPNRPLRWDEFCLLPDPKGGLLLVPNPNDSQNDNDNADGGGSGGHWDPFTTPLKEIFRRLRDLAKETRSQYMSGKPMGKGNVAAARLELDDGTVWEQTATSRSKPLDRPTPLSQGGQFEPRHAPESGREQHEIMDTDAEYKLYSWMDEQLTNAKKTNPRGTLYLYTEQSQCTSCLDV